VFSIVVVLSNVILITPSHAFSERLILCIAKLADSEEVALSLVRAKCMLTNTVICD